MSMSEQEVKVRSRTSRFVVPYIVLGLFVVLALGLVVLIRALADQGLLGTPASPYSDTPSHTESTDDVDARAYRAAFNAVEPYLREAQEHLRDGVTALDDAFDEVRRHALLHRDDGDVIRYHNELLDSVQEIRANVVNGIIDRIDDPNASRIFSMRRNASAAAADVRYNREMGTSSYSDASRRWNLERRQLTTDAALALLQAAADHFQVAADVFHAAAEAWDTAWTDQRIADGVVEKL